MEPDTDWEYIHKLQSDSPPRECVTRFKKAWAEVFHAFTGMLVGSLLLTGKVFEKEKSYYRLDNHKPFFKKDMESLAYRLVHNLYRLLILGWIVYEAFNWSI